MLQTPNFRVGYEATKCRKSRWISLSETRNRGYGVGIDPGMFTICLPRKFGKTGGARVRFFTYPTTGISLQFEIDGFVTFRDILSQCRLADLPRSKEEDACLEFQDVFDCIHLRMLDHTLHSFHVREDLRGYCQRPKCWPIERQFPISGTQAALSPAMEPRCQKKSPGSNSL